MVCVFILFLLIEGLQSKKITLRVNVSQPIIPERSVYQSSYEFNDETYNSFKLISHDSAARNITHYLLLCTRDHQLTSRNYDSVFDIFEMVSQSCSSLVQIHSGENIMNDQSFCIPAVANQLVLYSFGDKKDVDVLRNDYSIEIDLDNTSGSACLVVSTSYHMVKPHKAISYSDLAISKAHGNQNTELHHGHFIGFVSSHIRPCGRSILWERCSGGSTNLINSVEDSSTAAFKDISNDCELIARCMIDGDNLAINLMMFVTIFGHDTSLIDTSLVSDFNPPISFENPHVCSNTINGTASRVFNVSDNMKIGAIYLSSIRTEKRAIRVIACKSGIEDHYCNGDFMPLFEGEQVILPFNSSFNIGPGFQYKTVVVIHPDALKNNNSSICIDLKARDGPTSEVNVWLFAASEARIPPSSAYDLDLSCPFSFRHSINLIMYRVHMHSKGISAAAWVDHKNNWTHLFSNQKVNSLVGFQNVTHIRPGDSVHVRCSYLTVGFDKTTIIGEGSQNEMCNVYFYYISRFDGFRLTEDCFTNKRFNVSNAPAEQDLPRKSDAVSGSMILEGLLMWANQSSDKSMGIAGIVQNNDSLIVLKRHFDPLFDLTELFDSNNVLKNKLGVYKSKLLSVYDLQSETLKHECGAMRFYFPCGLFASKSGEFFITDLGLHQVLKFPTTSIFPNDHPDLILGTALIPGADENHFCMPTSVVVDHAGNIFVGDGLCNTRIVKFEDDGFCVGSFGKKGDTKGGKLGEFIEVTDIALDTSRNVIYVLDTLLRQIHVMSLLGVFLRLFIIYHPSPKKISYSSDMDAIVVLTNSSIITLHPTEGTELGVTTISMINVTTTALGIISVNNAVLVGDSSGNIHRYSSRPTPHHSSPSKDTKLANFEEIHGNVEKLYPLVNYLYRPGLEKLPKQLGLVAEVRAYMGENPLAAGTGIIAVFLVVLLVVIGAARCTRRTKVSAQYDRCLMSDSEAEDEVIYDSLHEKFEAASTL